MFDIYGDDNMTNKTLTILGIILCALCLQNTMCPFPSAYDYVIVAGGDILTQYVDIFALAGEPDIELSVEPGTYEFFGSVDFKAGAPRAASNSSGRAAYPPSVYLKLIKSILIPSGASSTSIDTDTIEIKLMVNPNTGEIPYQNVKIANQLVADPAKNEIIKFQIKTGTGKIPAGKNIKIGYTKKGA
jgi:hypothetical protein